MTSGACFVEAYRGVGYWVELRWMAGYVLTVAQSGEQSSAGTTAAYDDVACRFLLCGLGFYDLKCSVSPSVCSFCLECNSIGDYAQVCPSM
jgi:hypothetical protein